jgi:nitroreductase
MEFIDAIKGRQSIRAYKPEPVPKDLLRDILSTAILAPSWANTQPWEFVIVGGKKKAELDQLLSNIAKENKPASPDVEMPSPNWPEPHMKRLLRLIKEMPFLKQDSEHFRDMYKAWNAPNAIIVYADGALGLYALVDVGAVIQNILLTAYNYGLSTCCNFALVRWAEEVKKCLNIPQSKKLILGIGIGYPDLDSPLNKLRTTRDNLDTFVKWDL